MLESFFRLKIFFGKHFCTKAKCIELINIKTFCWKKGKRERERDKSLTVRVPLCLTSR